ncbi:MAG: hypothetical protein COV67_11695 [Nitrospinae bacterium CG11_big_fil_rev_8_21_14_0_20_56_8]|nr:MAG: hypothetical protein COV67_11695 [Nitrospinae bacterium CG11_big_fil_rev_8_21_14_0_20_56_8]
MPKPQSGILEPPGPHCLVLVLGVRDLPLCSMSVAKIGAMVPQLNHEVGVSYPGARLRAMVGFGPQLWNYINPSASTPGFSPPYDDEGEDEEGSGEDLLLFLSSEDPSLNDNLVQRVREVCGNLTRTCHETRGVYEGSSGLQVMEGAGTEQILIGSSDPELDRSGFCCFTLLEPGMDSEGNIAGILDETLLTYRFRTPEDCKGVLVLGAGAGVLRRWKEGAVEGARTATDLFLVPSLDLLTGLRMGGLRMGALSITSIWKDL